MGTWTALLALSLSFLSDCTSSSLHAYEVAKLTFTHGGKIESFFGANAVPGPPLNITDYRLKVDVDNLKNPECLDRGSVCDFESHRYRYPGEYSVVCDEGVSAQAIVDHCIGNEHLDLLILCVSESRARELLTGEGLRVDSERLTVILVNHSDVYRCPLRSRVSNKEIDITTNVTVTVQYAGMGSFPLDPNPTIYPPFFDQTTTFYFVMFAFCLLLLLALVWFAFNYLKRCHNVLSRRQARVCVYIYMGNICT